MKPEFSLSPKEFLAILGKTHESAQRIQAANDIMKTIIVGMRDAANNILRYPMDRYEYTVPENTDSEIVDTIVRTIRSKGFKVTLIEGNTLTSNQDVLIITWADCLV